MRKVLLSAMALALVATMVGFGVHAQFSDTELAITKVKAKTLDLTVDGKNGVPVTVCFEMAPGGCGRHEFKLKNIGNLAGWVDLENIKVTESENGIIEPEAEAGDVTSEVGELAGKLKIKLSYKGDMGCWTIYQGPLSGIASSYDVDGYLPPGDCDLLVEVIEWPCSTSDNTAQGDSAELSMTIVLEQFKD